MSRRLHYTIWDKPVLYTEGAKEFIIDDTLLLTDNYFNGLLKASPATITTYMVCYYKDDIMIGKAFFQLLKIELKNALKPQESGSKWVDILKQISLRLLNLKVLVSGNMMLTGEHAFYFDGQKIDDQSFFQLYKQSYQDLQKKTKPNVLLIKDFFESKKNYYTDFFGTENNVFKVDPNMILTLKEEWSTMDDYINAMGKKYRARVRTARKKSEGIEKRSLNIETLESEKNTMFKLYRNIALQASFNSFILPENYFVELKKELGNQFEVFGYYLDNTLIGFYSVFHNRTQLETHFLGYCPQMNREKQLYLNMLLDMANIGINEGLKQVIYGRTAIEIKSTIGAEPHEMYGYFKFLNPILHKLSTYIYPFLSKPTQYIYRSAFIDK